MESNNVLQFGRISHDVKTFESDLSTKTVPEEIYFTNGYSTVIKPIPSSLTDIIKDFISCWDDSDKYLLEKVVLFNFHCTPCKIDESKKFDIEKWKHFSHTGCIIIFNPNDIDYKIQIYEDKKQYDLVSGAFILIKTNVMFSFFSESKSSKLKHLVVYSFAEK